MSRLQNLPYEETIRMFVEKKFVDRPQLLEQVRREIWHSNATKYLIGELAEEAIKHGLPPTDCMGLSFIYGVVCGVLAQRQADGQRILRLT